MSILAIVRAVRAFLNSSAGMWTLLAIAVLFAGWRGYGTIYDRGGAACEGRHALALAAVITRAQEQAREIALQDAEILYHGAAERERIRHVYRDREVGIVKYLPPDCAVCRIAPAGIGLLNNALSNAAATPADPGSKSGPVPGPTIPDQGGGAGRGFRGLDSRGRQVL